MKYKMLRLSLMGILAMFAGLWGNGAWADSWLLTDATKLQTGDVVVIVDQTTTMAMPNDGGTSKAPAATAVTLSDDLSQISSDVADNLQWVVTADNGTYKFGVPGTENYLYCTSTNNGVRVGTNENNTFTWVADEENANSTKPFLVNVATARYIGVYNSQDWRCYGSINNNIKATVTAFYKLTANDGDLRMQTTLTLSDGYATTGEKGAVLPLPTATVTYVAPTAADPITIDDAEITWSSSNEDVATVSDNGISLLKAGTTVIKAAYAGDETNFKGSSASYTLTVTAPPYTSFAALQQDATTDKVAVDIYFDGQQVVFVNGKNAYLADDSGYGILVYATDHGLVAGEKLYGQMSTTLTLYQGNTEITSFDKNVLQTQTADVTPIASTPAKISACNQSALFTLKDVTYNATDKTFADADGNTIAYYDKFKAGVELEDGKAYDVTGIVMLYNTTIQISPRTADDVAEATADEPQWAWADIVADFTNQSFFTENDASITTAGLKMNADGGFSRVAADDVTANAVITGKYHSNEHGISNFSATVKVEGAVKISFGTCAWGGDVTVKNAEGETMATFNTNTGACYHNDKQANIVSAYYKEDVATTLTISGGSYVPYFAVEKVDPATIPNDINVTFTVGAEDTFEGVIPEATTAEIGKDYTLPKNFTLYKEGYTLTGWTDGTTVYAPGQTITAPESDLDLVAVFTANEANLADRTAAVTATFTFRRDQGAPTVAYQGQNGQGIWVTQAEVNGKAIDVKASFDATNGKFANGNWSDWAQLNAGTVWTVPSCKGATVSMEAFSDITTTTIDGQSDYTSGATISYEIANSAETINVVIGDGSYYRYIKVVLPVQQQGGEKYDNVAGTINWPVGNEDTPTISADIVSAISSASVSVGSGLTVSTATYFETEMMKYTPTTSNSGNVEGVMIEYRVKPAAGIKFKPTQVDYAAVKVGTDNATYSWSYTVDGQESSITEIDPKPNLLRNDGSNSSTAKLMHSEDLSKVSECDEFTFRFYISKTANNKNICIGNVTISGTVNGEAISVNMYSLATQAAPAEGGTVSVYPADDKYEEGSEVTLTATENFGYNFVNWTDAEGNEVSTEPKFKYTMTSDATLTANFEAVETYELALSVDGTNDYMVTVSPEPTVVDGKNMYEAGQAVQLTANQYEGLVTFNNWSDGETNSSKLISMTEDISLTAFYAQADIIAGWDFYTAGNNGRKADFYAQDNDGDALNLVNTETGDTGGWLDKSTLAAGGYEGLAGAAVIWQKGSSEGDVGHWHWQTKVNAEAFTDINVQFQMLYNYNAYQTYNAEYSLDGENWTNFGSVTMEGNRQVGTFSEKLPAEANNQAELYIRMLADKKSNVDGAASANDGNTLAMFFITGTPKLVDDGNAPELVSSVPADGATGVSASGKVVLTFNERVKLADSFTPTASIGESLIVPTVSGKTVTFEYKGLEYSKEYVFHLPGGSICDLTGNFIMEDLQIHFTTMVRPSVDKKMYDYVVENVDDLMAAIAAAESRSDKNVRYRIFVKNGEYTIPLSSTMKTVNEYEVPECITFVNSGNVSFIGESRDGVIITNGIDKSETFNGQFGLTSKYDGIGNSDVFQLRGSGYYWQDLTVESGMDDATGRDLAIQDRGTKNVYKNVGLRGYQDTWTSNNDNGQYYFEGGYVRGRTDYMCGKGDIFWNGVELRQIAGGYASVPSKPKQYGWVYKDCVINGEPAVVNASTGEMRTAAQVDGNYTLGRPWGKGTPISLFIDTKMNVVPSAIGWNEMSGGWPARFAEFNSTTSSGTQIDLSGRKKWWHEGGKENNPTVGTENNPILTAEEALLNGDLHRMFGDWDPTLLTEQAPIPTGVKQNGGYLEWENSDYALLWAVVLDGKVIDFTVEPKFEIISDGTYSVRAANEMGGLSEASEEVVTSGVTDGIYETVNPLNAVPETIYNINGVRVEKAQKGLYIINGKKIVVR